MIKQSGFKPCKLGKNPHVQTILPTWLRNSDHHAFITQRLEMDDGDFIDLAWTALPTGKETGPILVIFHGLEGSADSHYVKGLFKMARKKGWIAVLMHFRGCSREPNRLARSYHSGETGDAGFLIQYLTKRFPLATLFGIGFSLGANMLLKYLAEQNQNSPLQAAITVSVPFDLAGSVRQLETGFSRVYQRHLMTCLKDNFKRKMIRLNLAEKINLPIRKMERFKTIREFDNLITAPIHGFKDADDYYGKCSCRQFLKDITTRTLIIHAADDPFVARESIPDSSDLSEDVTLELSENGGHVGFITDCSPFKPRYWLDERIPEFIEKRLKHRMD